MKIIFSLVLTAVLFIGASSSFASHIQMPNLPIEETAYNIEEYDYLCGHAIWYDFLEWVILTVDDKWVLIGEKKSEKIWVNRDGDDHLDEFYGNGDHGFETKYQNICDIIKK
ncbi:hypothetical protein A2W54_01420 [Candidatus Giovannonibacteria bacterium RIFCSPHIGHO2_02_43_13]|uniref:Uncharacterized protein n=1 Tax=Candidatus Giovannonibacteria bacterium RIFCSPHIGHO2_02_43_13 TaxID=1798330 RepID=A0A1F5WUU0_9BACT|nr:MAG: hypothetical protein UW28_C0016G0010 [Parcubacteria group bacterium GW2011_GWA2_44_13]OGF71794.1 MAG: hypothetical protein A3E06_01475 [Candidatus Giovannonibacteria bacterium RIFCSPHIGHO2_12_FULL_44_42]OGF79373.1 MAG: hypothetical protein A2W54_01420 [Candidatus Giovannonibacteria bacterium RIFCSPHIGHO2_02_43_13]OGF89926.1 MAG: hypothetical protein A3I94_00845 [Candidatus Giovannonibacteria bacterium RIFCSPLOWO2_02_FULL_43_54]OGF97340.1 MAG: hypothetical protein A3H08_03125 [Candidatus